MLNEGIIQQVDTPQMLYTNPANIFVAGFIGSPAMNFFDGTLIAEGEALTVDAGAVSIKIDPAHAAAFRSHAGKEVILGIRPEDIHDSRYLPAGISPWELEANVDVVEQMGNEVVVYLNEKGASFISRMDPRCDAVVGDRLKIAVNIDNIHLFDPATRESLDYQYRLEHQMKLQAERGLRKGKPPGSSGRLLFLQLHLNRIRLYNTGTGLRRQEGRRAVEFRDSQLA